MSMAGGLAVSDALIESAISSAITDVTTTVVRPHKHRPLRALPRGSS